MILFFAEVLPLTLERNYFIKAKRRQPVMISKISYIKLIREDIRHRGWLAALSGVLLFLSMPVYTLIYLDSYSEDPEVLKEFADTFSGFINGYNSAFLIILIGILAFAVGISGFQFMHKKEKLDFYHGLALKRHQLFAISYLAGLFLFLIPYIVCTVLTILVGAVKGIMTLSLAGECFLTMGTGILAFLLIYHTCIFAGMLTGRSVTMFLRNTCHRSLSKPRIDTASVAARCVFPDNL